MERGVPWHRSCRATWLSTRHPRPEMKYGQCPCRMSREYTGSSSSAAAGPSLPKNVHRVAAGYASVPRGEFLFIFLTSVCPLTTMHRGMTCYSCTVTTRASHPRLRRTPHRPSPKARHSRSYSHRRPAGNGRVQPARRPTWRPIVWPSSHSGTHITYASSCGCPKRPICPCTPAIRSGGASTHLKTAPDKEFAEASKSAFQDVLTSGREIPVAT